MEFDTLLDRYARLALQVGVDHRAGQRVLLRSPIVAAPLARRVAALAYGRGAPFVDVVWSDEEVTRSRFLHAPEGSFDEVPVGRAEAMTRMAERGDAVISIDASDPELLADADPERVATARRANLAAMKPFSRHVMADRVPWTVLAVPTAAWAVKVFPDEEPERAIARLWDAVALVTRVTADDPEAAWREHVATLKVRSEFLNDRRFDALHFRGPGTDLTVGLADEHVWNGGASRSEGGHTFVANLPTEEVFTAPHRERVDGIVRASMPLIHDGRRIEGFELRFEGGRVVSARADHGQDVLDGILATDEGARRLGEVALVSRDSPVRRTGLLFHNTLFDENAASHLALGQAYRFCTADGPALGDDEVAARGLNESLAHVDFMIGTPDTDVDGVGRDGSAVPLVRSGRFVI